MKLILDASVVIDFLRRKDKLNSLYMQAAYEEFDFVMSGVTVAEVFSGASAQKGGKQNQEWETILSGIEIRGVDIETARVTGKIRNTYRLSLGDAFVAALALEENLTLATLDSGDFRRVKGLKLYQKSQARK